ncbi:hypothetical protein [Luteolibacter marinus]|uniref:hypothetical protein n=1 Tax=Luteolibacter marinus TaxID=2776705 RepID=UPI001867BCDF|nr:hypothetical protein [Luteolibacter marinus]
MKSLAAAVSLALSAAAQAAGSPGEAALTFLRGLSGENGVFAVGDTAISPEIPADRRADIASRLSRLGRHIRPDDLRVLEEKQDGDLAAVLISQVTDFDSDSVQVHAVGMVKSDNKWLPAPLPSSFNSTGLSFRPGFLERMKGLESWMLNARSQQLVRLKNDIFSLLSDEMKKAKSPDELHEATPEKLALEFLAALKARDLPATLALAGGLESPRPSDWDETFQAVSRLFRSKRIRHPGWRLLAAPEALRAIVLTEQQGDDGYVSIVAIDPAADFDHRPQAKAIHLPFARSKAGLWRVVLPVELLAPATTGSDRDDEDEIDPIDANLISSFPEKLAETLGSERKSTPQAAAESMISALRAPTLEPLGRSLDLSGAADALETLSRAARLWQTFHYPDEIVSPLLLEVHEFGVDACAIIQEFSARNPEKPSLQALFFKKDDKGWRANRGFSGASALAFVDDSAGAGKWLGTALKEHGDDFSSGVLTRVGGVPADSAPTEEEARKVVEDWRQAVADRDGARMLALSACFDDHSGSKRALRNTGYELLAGQPGEVLGVHRSGRWAAVSMRVPPEEGDDSADSFPLYLVVTTEKGPRVLPELDLFDPLTRSREFLNRRVWDRIDDRLPNGARTELEAIFEKHREVSASAREHAPISNE